MKAKLIRVDTNSADSIEKIRSRSTDSFGIWLTASIGSDEISGADDFQIFFCTEEWLNQAVEGGHEYPKKFMLVAGEADSDAIIEDLKNYLDDCEADNWQGIVDQISQIGTWEFEGYKS